ncbi:MAG: leucine-rich repeat domain-containing protein [Bacteroidota bacterium]|nr:leucine-rich repeat domain-containing protein [Bacteroidota bacterium]
MYSYKIKYFLLLLLTFHQFNLNSQVLSDEELTSTPVFYVIPQDSFSRVYKMELEDISGIPADIGKLYNLQSLKIFSDDWNWLLDSIPESLYHIGNLQKLEITHSQLKKLSPSIAYLKKLRYLSLAGNQLTSLPDDLAGLDQLKVLKIDGKIRKVPASPSLQELTCCLDAIHHGLPEGIGKLSNLKRLIIDFPDGTIDFSDLFSELQKLPELRSLTLNLRGVNDSILESLSKYTRLEELQLEEAEINTPVISKFKSLRRLEIGYVYSSPLYQPSAVFYESLNQLPSLKQFSTGYKTADLQYYKRIPLLSLKIENAQDIENIILRLSTVKGLTGLYLPELCETIPASINQLSQLKEIDLSHNYFKDYKQVFKLLSQLRSLEKITISNDQLVQFPDEVKDLKQLKFFYVINQKHGIYDPISQSEQGRLKGLIPNCQIYFQN